MLSIVLPLMATVGIMSFFLQAVLPVMRKVLSSGSGLLIDNIAALYDFTVLAVKVITALLLGCSLLRVSNHIVISLDIVYLFSILILILFQIIKQSAYLPSRENI